MLNQPEGDPMQKPTMLFLALGMAFAAPASHADALTGISHCFDKGEFHANSRDHRTAGSPWRDVRTANGPARVSVVDGYRLMVYRDSTEPLVNLKLERSADGQFAADRAAIASQMAAASAKSAVRVENSTREGIDIVAINNPALGTPGVISMVTLFDAATATIATAYILNQAPAVREYKDQAAYDALRDRFVTALAVCMAHPPQ